MRGKVVKRLLKVAKEYSQSLPWEAYKYKGERVEFEKNVYTEMQSTTLYQCGKAFYKQLKKMYKSTKVM